MMRVAFIGLGAMGCPMATTLGAAGFAVQGHDVSAVAVERFRAAGGTLAASPAAALAQADAVVTMLPEGRQVRAAYRGEIFEAVAPGALLVDCSTIDVATSRALAAEAADGGWPMIDAPVSGGPEGATSGALSFMVGGPEEAVERARPLLAAMGRTNHHFGPAGCGQAAKACHNMICGITMAGVAEAFVLAERLGLDPERFFALCNGAAARSWILENRCPVPGPAPAAPANAGYTPGFAARLMAKDLDLAQQAADGAGLTTRLGAEAAGLYRDFVADGGGDLDMSAIIFAVRDEEV